MLTAGVRSLGRQGPTDPAVDRPQLQVASRGSSQSSRREDRRTESARWLLATRRTLRIFACAGTTCSMMRRPHRCLLGAVPFFGSTCEMASPAGLSLRCPAPIDHRITVPIRCRSRLAVSCFPPFQIGVSTDSMSALVTAPIGLLPIIGETNRLNNERQMSAVRGLRQVLACISMTVSAALSKLGVADPCLGSCPW